MKAGQRPQATHFIPEWEVPDQVHAATTFRTGGASTDRYASFNLANHVGDDIESVLANRRVLEARLALPSSPSWLEQVHGNEVIRLTGRDNKRGTIPTADAAYTKVQGVVCAVLTADCLPLLLCSQDGSEIAAVHCGWRGLQLGVIEASLAQFTTPTNDILAWLGPCISVNAYEVGLKVWQSFISIDSDFEAAFRREGSRIFLSISEIAAIILTKLGVNAITDSKLCSYSATDDFYSFRRDGITGRFATLIWKI